MKIKWYLLISGALQEQPSPLSWRQIVPASGKENWFDIDSADPGELRSFLEHLTLHPLQIDRCVDSINDPGVISFGNTLLLEYPTTLNAQGDEPGFLTILINESTLLTIRHEPNQVLDELQENLLSQKTEPVHHLPQIVYLILDQFADRNVESQIAIREQILRLSKTMVENPASVNANLLSGLRWKVDTLVSLIENQLYCVTGLNASDNKALQGSHRKAYIEDLVSEAELAQRGIYRLENRLNSLYNDYQVLGSERVEKRLRFLTIVSVITLPLGLIAGLLGMNVGGLPGTTYRYGFLVVVILMLAIGLLQYWYFKKYGWFD